MIITMSVERSKIVYSDSLNHALAEHDPFRIKGWALDLISQAEEALVPTDSLPVRIGKLVCRAGSDFMESMAAAGSPDALDAHRQDRLRATYA